MSLTHQTTVPHSSKQYQTLRKYDCGDGNDGRILYHLYIYLPVNSPLKEISTEVVKSAKSSTCDPINQYTDVLEAADKQSSVMIMLSY